MTRQTTTLPPLMNAQEVARWLRTTRKAVYAMAAREQIPGQVRVGTRLLFDTEVLRRWVEGQRR